MRYNRPMNRQAALRFLPVLVLVAVLIANVPLIFQTAAPDLFFLVVAYSILALGLAFYVFDMIQTFGESKRERDIANDQRR